MKQIALLAPITLLKESVVFFFECRPNRLSIDEKVREIVNFENKNDNRTIKMPPNDS